MFGYKLTQKNIQVRDRLSLTGELPRASTINSLATEVCFQWLDVTNCDHSI